MSRAKGKGKSARQKQRRRQKRALTKSGGEPTVFASIDPALLTEEGRKLRHASKHCRNGMLGQMLFEDIARRMKDADNERIERLVVGGVRSGMRMILIPDAYLKDTFYEVWLAMASQDEITALMLKYHYHRHHVWDEDGSTCTECGDKDWTGQEWCLREPVDCTDHICTNDCDTCECVGKLGVQDENTTTVTIGGVTTDGNGTCE